MQPAAFTISAQGLLPVLITTVDIFPPFDPTTDPEPPHCTFDAIWDTGATSTAITHKVVSACGLTTTGPVQITTPTETRFTNAYVINLRLPTGVGFPGVTVVEASNIGGADVLVGMDIITRGDFVITNLGRKTTFSFRTPSIEQVDFVTHPNARFSTEHVGRNSPCPCGSGEKYKKCCGKGK
jgi:hypothetical protein